MPLLSYEGVEVDIPTTLAGIQFTFTNGALTIQCTNFTGDVVLSKPAAAVPQPTAPPARPATANGATASAKKRSLQSRSVVQDNNNDDDNDDSDSSASSKRARPNFLNDVEQSLLLAQLQTVSQSSTTSTKREDADSLVSSSGASLADKEPSRSSTASSKATAPARASAAASAKASTLAKKSAATVQTTLFSPDAGKPLSARKATPESQKKRSRPPKASSAPAAPRAAASTKAPVRGEWQVVPTQGTAPVERWGDSATKIANDRVVVYGGADDDEQTLGSVHVFDLKTRTWSEPLNCTSLPRAWHDAVYLASKHLLLVFGGERFMGGDQMDVLADIMVLDTECFLWYPPAVSGVAPAARSGHSCTVVGDDVVVFGGSRGRSRQSTVHVLNSNTWHWTPVKVDGKPPTARTYHSAVAVGDSVVYFGGNDAKKSFNSVHVLLKKDSGTWSWFHPCVVGTPPQARTGHSATLIDGTKILVFGGWDPQREAPSDAEPAAPSVFSDAFVLDTESWEWTPVAISGSGTGDAATPLPGRVGHRAVLDAHNNVVVFGGQDSNDKRLNAVHSIALQLSGAQEQPEPETSTVALEQ